MIFNERKGKTIFQKKKGNKFYKKVILEEHVSVIEEPNSKNLGHVTPKSGSGKDVADSILHLLKIENTSNFWTILLLDAMEPL